MRVERRIYPRRQAFVTRKTTKKIDAIDAQLLALLQRDALKPARVLAQALHISVSSVQRRIRELRQRGVIERVAALVEPSLAGYPITVVVDVWLERPNPGRPATAVSRRVSRSRMRALSQSVPMSSSWCELRADMRRS